MIRKLFAAFFLALFVLLVAPLIILESAVLSFLRPASIEQTIIPESFEPVSTFVASQFAKTPAETTLFAERMRLLVPRETYNEIMRSGASLLFSTIKDTSLGKDAVISLDPFKAALQKRVPEIVERMPVCAKSEEMLSSLRFCKPAKGLSKSQMEHSVADVIEKEIPPRLAFTIPGNTASLATTALPLSLAIIALILLFFISFCVWGTWATVLRWLGLSFMGLTGFIILFIISIYRLNEFTPLFADISEADWKLFEFLIQYPIRLLMLFCILLGLISVSAITTSFARGLHNKIGLHNKKRKAS